MINTRNPYLQSRVLSHSSVIFRVLPLHFRVVDDEHVQSHDLQQKGCTMKLYTLKLNRT